MPDTFLLFDSRLSYEPVVDCMNVDFDSVEGNVVFNPDVLVAIMENFTATQSALFKQLELFRSAPKMQQNFAINVTFQTGRLSSMKKLVLDQVTSPHEIALYNGFMMEYSDKKKFNQLVAAEAVIQKYIALGLSESLLRQIAAMTLR